MAKKIVVFDFDGVLLDSSNELVVAGYNLDPNNLAKTVAEVDPQFFKVMRSHLNYARNGGETSTLAKLMHQSTDFNYTRVEFDAEVRSLYQQGKILAVQSAFFSARRKLMQTDKEAWLKLNQVANPLWDFLCQTMQGEVTILTYKNPDAVTELCSYFGLNLKEVFAIPSGITKAKALVEIAQNNQATEVYYVDDAYKNLLEIRSEITNLTVHYLWATWGYGYEASLADPTITDIYAIKQEKLIEIIQGL